jgi:hypothetical protein
VQGAETGDAGSDFLGSTNKRVDQRLVDVEVPFVFRDVALPVRMIEYSPLLWREFDGVLQALKLRESVL